MNALRNILGMGIVGVSLSIFMFTGLLIREHTLTPVGGGLAILTCIVGCLAGGLLIGGDA